MPLSRRDFLRSLGIGATAVGVGFRLPPTRERAALVTETMRWAGTPVLTRMWSLNTIGLFVLDEVRFGDIDWHIVETPVLFVEAMTRDDDIPGVLYALDGDRRGWTTPNIWQDPKPVWRQLHTQIDEHYGLVHIPYRTFTWDGRPLKRIG